MTDKHDDKNEIDEKDWVDRAFEVIDPIVDRVAGVMSNLHAPDKEYTREGVKRLTSEDVEDAVIVSEVGIPERTRSIELVIHLETHSVRLYVQDVAKAQNIMREDRISVGQWLREVVRELELVKKQLKSGEGT